VKWILRQPVYEYINRIVNGSYYEASIKIYYADPLQYMKVECQEYTMQILSPNNLTKKLNKWMGECGRRVVWYGKFYFSSNSKGNKNNLELTKLYNSSLNDSKCQINSLIE
jgi:hypothetical protein